MHRSFPTHSAWEEAPAFYGYLGEQQQALTALLQGRGRGAGGRCIMARSWCLGELAPRSCWLFVETRALLKHVIPEEMERGCLSATGAQPAPRPSKHRGQANTCVGLFRGPGMLARKVHPAGAQISPPLSQCLVKPCCGYQALDVHSWLGLIC